MHHTHSWRPTTRITHTRGDPQHASHTHTRKRVLSPFTFMQSGEKRNENLPECKGRRQVSLLTDSVICQEEIRESMKRAIKTNKLIQTSIAICITIMRNPKVTLRRILLSIASKRVKYLEINLTKMSKTNTLKTLSHHYKKENKMQSGKNSMVMCHVTRSCSDRSDCRSRGDMRAAPNFRPGGLLSRNAVRQGKGRGAHRRG